VEGSGVGEVEQGSSDMDQNQVKRWREQSKAVTRGEERGGVGLNPNRPPFIPLPHGTQADQAAAPCQLGPSKPRAHQPGLSNLGWIGHVRPWARPLGPSGLGHTVLWPDWFYFFISFFL
jgi:hypothetical protein